MTNQWNDVLLNMVNGAISMGGTIASGAVEKAGQAYSFIEGELPFVVKEILLYNGVASFITWLLCGFILPYLVFLLIRAQVKYCKRNELDFYNYAENFTSLPIIFTIIASIAALIFGLAALIGAYTWLKILLAPRLYLIEYSAELASKLAGN